MEGDRKTDYIYCQVREKSPGDLIYPETWRETKVEGPVDSKRHGPSQSRSPSNRAAADPGRRRPPPVESVVDQIYAAKPYAN